MHDQVTWQLIPSGVVSKILWSEDLQLSDKLRCQSVCKTWRWSLQEVPSDSLPNSSTYDLAVELLKGWAARSPTQWRNETPPRLMLWTRDTATTTSFSNLFPACHRWLTLKAPLLRRIHLTGHYPELGHFRDVFSILQAQSLRLPPILEVKLSSGSMVQA